MPHKIQYRRRERGYETRATAIIGEDGSIRFLLSDAWDTVASEFVPCARELCFILAIAARGLDLRGLCLNLDDDWSDEPDGDQDALRWIAGSEEILDECSRLADSVRSLRLEHSCERETAERLIALVKEGQVLCDCEILWRSRGEAFLRKRRIQQRGDSQILEVSLAPHVRLHRRSVDCDLGSVGIENSNDPASDFNRAPRNVRELITQLGNRFGALRVEATADRRKAEMILALCEEGCSIAAWWASWKADVDAIAADRDSAEPIESRDNGEAAREAVVLRRE